VTGVDGTYSLTSLTPGTYKLEFYDSSGVYVSEFYNAQPTLAKATSVAVRAGATTGDINGTLDVGGRISGTVTSAADKSPVAGAWVNVYQLVGSSWLWINGGEAADNGQYAVGGLRTGVCKVEFLDESGALAWEFYDGKSTLAKATPVSVRMGHETPNINATLDPGGAISGKVTSAADNSPAVGMIVVVYRLTSGSVWEPFNYAETGSDGHYTLGGLRTGNYKIEFFDPYGTCASEFYDNKPTLVRANQVGVIVGTTTANVNAALDLLSSSMFSTSRRLPDSVLSPYARARSMRM